MEIENQNNQTSKPKTASWPARSLLHTLAPIFVILAAIFWGILVVFVRAFGQADFKSMEIVTLRVYSSTIFAWIFLLIFDRNSQRKIRQIQHREKGEEYQMSQRNGQNQYRSAHHQNSKQSDRYLNIRYLNIRKPCPTKDISTKSSSGKNISTKNTSGKNTLTTFRLCDSWCFIGTGLVSIVFFSYCYFRNVEVSSAAVAAILMYTSPIFVTLMSALFFKEKLTKVKIIALILAIIGCALVSGIAGGIGGTTPLGIALGLGSGIGYALYSIFGRFALNKGYSPFMVTAMTFTFACVGVLPFIDITGLATRLVTEPKYIALALLMGLIGSCTPFALYTLGLRYMEASKAAILATLEPIVTALVGTFFYKEPLDFFTIVGIIMVLMAGILCSAPAYKK